MTERFFISDLHLDPRRPDITEGLEFFLSNVANNACELYILGDLFEAWLGDDDDTSEYREVIALLQDYQIKNSVSLFVMHGNRDFMLGKQFAKQAGATLINDPHLIDLDGTACLLSHGDSLCTDDTDYMTFREMVRNPDWQAMMMSKPLSERKAYAQQARSTSKQQNREKAEDIMDVTQSSVVALLNEHSVYTLLHGHTHRPDDHQFTIDLPDGKQDCRRLVLGDWDTHGWYAKACGRKLTLHQWPLHSPQRRANLDG